MKIILKIKKKKYIRLLKINLIKILQIKFKITNAISLNININMLMRYDKSINKICKAFKFTTKLKNLIYMLVNQKQKKQL